MNASIIRQDAIDPLEGGGSVENDLASFVSGTGITPSFSREETTVMVGIIPVLLMIIGLVYGRKEITVPSYCVLLFSMIWAGGGKTLVSIIHFLPFVDNFRVSGRIFGSLLPIVLFIALYGIVTVYDKVKSGEAFDISPDQRQERYNSGYLRVLGIRAAGTPLPADRRSGYIHVCHPCCCFHRAPVFPKRILDEYPLVFHLCTGD